MLVAATGIGLAGCRWWLGATRSGWGDLWPSGDQSLLTRLWIAVLGAIPVSSILLLSWSTAILLVRLRSGRPRRRHLWCQPGFLACFAAVFAYAWKSVGLALLLGVEFLSATPAQLSTVDYGQVASQFILMLLGSPFGPQANVGGVILLLWLVTCASGRCRPEPSWVDRAGRVLGSLWVCLSLVSLCATVG
jgi:hypothetical protein